MLDAAVFDWANARGKMQSELPTWQDCKPYIKTDSRIFRNQGNDVFGRPYILAPMMEGSASVDPQTVAALAWVVDPKKFASEADLTGQRRSPAPKVILAARQRNTVWLTDLLNQGADIDQPDLAGRTALHWAARLGDTRMAQEICSRHPRPVDAIDQENVHGRRSPMGEAIRQGHADVVAVFLNHGAFPGPRNLSYAASQPEVLRLLLTRGMSPDATQADGEPILLLASYDNPACARLLIEAGANVNVRRKNGHSAVRQALAGHHPEVAELLRAAGARDWWAPWPVL